MSLLLSVNVQVLLASGVGQLSAGLSGSRFTTNVQTFHPESLPQLCWNCGALGLTWGSLRLHRRQAACDPEPSLPGAEYHHQHSPIISGTTRPISPKLPAVAVPTAVVFSSQ